MFILQEETISRIRVSLQLSNDLRVSKHTFKLKELQNVVWKISFTIYYQNMKIIT